MTDVAADIAVNGKSKKSRKSETLANGEPAAVASPNSTPDESSTAPIDDPPRKKKSRKSKADETVTGESSALVNTEPATNPEPIMNGHSVDKKQKKDKKSKTEKSNGVSILPVSDELPSAPNANDLIPMPTIESEAHLSKKDRQKKAKKEKKEQAKAEAKAREAELLALEPPAPQNDALANGEAVLEPNKSKRGKEGKAQVVEIVEETGASQDAPKEKKKKSKREKREEAAAA
ncbi:hypothetical protein FRC08_001745 [Ceratobasidium sp. 394]|nr:hypothetical protein FRC08_001745 [Ceratobasidium sp. 394]